MDYKKLHEDTITKLQEMVNSGKITVEVARGICADFIPESEDERIRKASIEFVRQNNSFNYCLGISKEVVIAWLEKQGEEIMPLEEIIHNVWELGNYWKELTKGVCNTEHGTQLDYILKHWTEGDYYIKSLKKQGEQKQVIEYPDSLPKDNWELIREFITKFGRIPKDEDELNVLVEYVLKRQKPAWSEEDEKKRQLLIKVLEVNHPNGHFKVNPINTTNMEAISTKELVDWLKSLKERNKR